MRPTDGALVGVPVAGSAISPWSAWREGISGKIIEQWMRVPFVIRSSGVWDWSCPVLDTVAGPVLSACEVEVEARVREGERRGGSSERVLERWDSRRGMDIDIDIDIDIHRHGHARRSSESQRLLAVPEANFSGGDGLSEWLRNGKPSSLALPSLSLSPHCPAEQARQHQRQTSASTSASTSSRTRAGGLKPGCSGAQQCCSMMAAWWCRGPEGNPRLPLIGPSLRTLLAAQSE
jgi:hypothetical protein